MSLVEPDLLTRHRVDGRGLADLAAAQAVVAAPLELQAGAASEGFDLGPGGGAEDVLPRQIDSLAVVADVADPQARKLLPDLRRDASQHPRLSATGVSPPVGAAMAQQKKIFCGQLRE